MSSVSKRLLWINGGIFLVFLLLRSWEPAQAVYYEWLALNPLAWVELFPFVPVWQLATYGFLHSLNEPYHLLFNLLGLYFFGSMLEQIVGGRRFLTFYLAAIALGGVTQLAAALITSSSVPTLGASGGVLASIVACAVLRPATQVIFILFPMSLRTLALILVGLDLFGLASGAMGTAYLVHLSGAALGFAAARLGWIWVDPGRAWAARREHSARRREATDSERLDRILQQIHREGMSSLSRGDREFLRKVSSRH
ncbi:MAG TPA: rhomboid family intramembrane serine protease [Planctomycetota bacterium]|nr:rhomboid family intramembrane serine protease [Planctomycetota bacterium]